MIPWSDLLLPSLLSAVLVFFLSFLIHAVFQLHKADYRKFANEDEVRAAIRKSSPTPGMYVFPHCKDGKEAQTPEMVRKFEEGPNGVTYIRAAHKLSLGPFLGKWFVYTLVVSLIAGYVARAVLPAGAHYLDIFRVAGTTAWLAYAWQGPADSIWAGKPWSTTVRGMVDGLLYACLTAGAFGWLWPEA